MRVEKILENSDIQDIPILYVLRVITAIQKEILNEQPSRICENLSKNNKQSKE